MSNVIISNTLDKKEVAKLWNLDNVQRKLFGITFQLYCT